MNQQRRRFSWPLVILVAQMLLVGAWLGGTERLRPQVINDTPLYDEFPWHSWEAALSNHRAPGYPAFLEFNRLISEEFQSVPLAHYIVYSAAVLIFFFGVRAATSAPGAACAAASMLLYSRILHGYVDTIASETLAAAAGIAVCGLTLWRLATAGRLVTVCLVAAVFAGWFVRPAYLFLVPLVPILTWLLDPVRPAAARRSRWLNVLFALMLTAGPLLGYSLLRYCVVGRMGIVSSGGYNQIGITGQFLDEAGLDELPDDLRPTAETALQRRASGTLRTSQYDDLPRMNYMRLENRYDITIWREFVPAAEQHVGSDHKRINTRLRRLAGELIRMYPQEFAVWIAKATRQAAKKVLWDFADNPISLALLLLAIMHVCRSGFLTDPRRADATTGQSGARILLVLAVTYLVLNLAVVILVCPPLGRMTDAAAVMLASPLAVWLWESWRAGRNRLAS